MSSVASGAVAIAGSLPRACAHCPWRLSNQGTRHPHGFYTQANLRRLWTGLRTGKAPGMTCHPTDPRMAEWEGYEALAERDEARECAGAITLVTRELVRFQAIMLAVDRGDHGPDPHKELARKLYREQAPRGLTVPAMAEVFFRFTLGDSPMTRAIHATAALINDPEVGYRPLGVWDPAIFVASQEGA